MKIEFCKQCTCSFIVTAVIPARLDGFCSPSCQRDHASERFVSPEESRQKLARQIAAMNEVE